MPRLIGIITAINGTFKAVVEGDLVKKACLQCDTKVCHTFMTKSRSMTALKVRFIAVMTPISVGTCKLVFTPLHPTAI